MSPVRLNDNQWHTITIERNKRRAILNIDSKHKLNGSFDEVNYVGYGNLLSDGYLRFGGFRKLPSGFSQSFYQGFQGCISEFKVDDRYINLIRNNLNYEIIPARCSESVNQKYKKNGI